MITNSWSFPEIEGLDAFVRAACKEINDMQDGSIGTDQTFGIIRVKDLGTPIGNILIKNLDQVLYFKDADDVNNIQIVTSLINEPAGTFDGVDLSEISLDNMPSTIGGNVDFGDYDLTSIDKLEGVDTNVFIDLGVTDLIETKGNIIPFGGNADDLGSLTKQFKDLYVDGKVYIDGLGEDLLVDLDTKIQFGDTAVHIQSDDDGHLDLTADVSIDLNADIKTDRWLNQDSNTFIGMAVAGAGNLSLGEADQGKYNTFIGNAAGYSSFEGYRNTAVGAAALYSISYGDNNVAIGVDALYSLTEGDRNIAIGVEALHSTTTGHHNTAIGIRALGYNTEGHSNIAINMDALNRNISGNHNIALGIDAFYYTTGSYNIGIGGYAGENIQDGSNNVLIGYWAGRGVSLHDKSGGVFIGYKAGYNETGSNKLYIANSDTATPLIYGEFDNAILTINGAFTATGAVTIPTTADDETYTGIVTNDSGVLKYRTKQQLSDDLEATIDHDNLLNFAANEHFLITAITDLEPTFEATFVKQVEANVIRDNITLNAWKIATQHALSVLKMEDGIIDVFTDETGIDTGNCINQSYSASGDFYEPTGGTELDYMEYSSDALAQAEYVSSDAESIEENFETGADNTSFLGDSGGNDYWEVTKFTTSSAIICPAASIYLEGVVGSPTGDLTLRIETDVGDEPSGTLAHANATGTTTPSQPAWNKCSFTPFNLPAGTYWLVAYIPDQATDNYWQLTRDDNGVGVMGYSVDHGANWIVHTNQYMPYFRIYGIHLQCYSEDTIVEQGTYSLKAMAKQTDSLNDTLTRTVSPTIDLSDQDTYKFYIYASRTGSNIKIGIHDSGGTTTEITPNVTDANTQQLVTVDLSGVANANKDDIDSIIITIVNADADNTFYLDWMRTPYENMTLISESWEAEAEPTESRLQFLMEDVDAATINTDILGYVSLDDGSNWEQVTLVDEGDFETGKKIIAGSETLTDRNDQTMVYKIVTANNKHIKIHRVGQFVK